MKDFIIAFIIGFIMGAGLILSMARHETANMQVRFGEAIIAIQMRDK
jgi:hypothetical protein